MAETVHLYIYPDSGGAPIEGESTQHSLGRRGSIECVEFAYTLTAPMEAGTQRPVGRGQHSPIVIRKRIDASSPHLAKLLVEHRSFKGVFNFFRPDARNTGATELFYEVVIEGARLETMTQSSDSPINVLSVDPPHETLSFVFSEITWTHLLSNTAHHDSWATA